MSQQHAGSRYGKHHIQLRQDAGQSARALILGWNGAAWHQATSRNPGTTNHYLTSV